MKEHIGNGKRMNLTGDNEIEIWSDGDVKTVFDFNTYYEGSYPACHFTAVGVGGGLLYAAGTTAAGVPHLFSSVDGGVWTQVNITSRLKLTQEAAYGDILEILYDGCSHQSFLLTRNGYLITLPDCPKCVRVRCISDLPLKTGRIEGDIIYIYDTKGKCLAQSLSLAVQYRCSWIYAKPHIGKDGVLLDLRNLQDASENRVYGAVVFPEEKIEAFLEKCPKGLYIFFLCELGIKADDAVQEARMRGFDKAYSLGGLGDILLDIKPALKSQL